ncbi:unnamed protein product [Owenia fusiformis]|uniref:Uncharacterized protein n=1 Tax=Owenia fusiformis TaxID=6347 RepID=A0A8J1TR33_OWEFU|nr:unnamed protein product [Owenia fusiformis]
MATSGSKISEISEQLDGNVNQKKYLALKKKCEQCQLKNEKLVNRIYQCKRLVKRYKKERRFLTKRLESYGDNYKDAQVPAVWEESQLHQLLQPPPPYNNSSSSNSTKKIKSKPQTIQQRLAKAQNAKIAKSKSDLPPSAPNSSPPKQTLPVKSGGSQSIKTLIAQQAAQNSVPASGGITSHVVEKIKKEQDIAVRRAGNAFVIFCQQYQKPIQEKFFKDNQRDMNQQELGETLAEMWSKTPENEKQIYLELYEAQKAQRAVKLDQEKRDKQMAAVKIQQVKESNELNAAISGIPS